MLIIVLGLAAGIVWFLQFHERGGSSPGTPLVLISIDTCRADAVSGFGAPPEQTPNLLKIGDEGMRFEQAISATHITATSHATMLTGYSPYVHATGMSYKKTSAIPPTMPTLGEILQKFGYYSAGYTDAGQMVAEAGFARGFDYFISDPSGVVEKLPKIESFLDQVEGRPFFLFVHTYRAHEPYRAPLRLLPKLTKNYNGPFSDGARVAAHTPIRESLTNGGKLELLSKLLDAKKAATAADREFFHNLYLAGVTGADEEVGALFDIFKKRGIYDRAMIVITSDHGEAFFEHGTDSHKDIYEECIRVPLIVRFPGGAHAGARIAEQFPSVNLVPTLLDFLNINHTESFEGRSVAREAFAGKLPEQIAYQHWLMGMNDRMPQGFGARLPGSKWIVKNTYEHANDPGATTGSQEYYNLQIDPREATNLKGRGDAGEKRMLDELAAMRPKWDSLRKHFHPDGVKLLELSDEAMEKLRQIGYLFK